MKRRDFLTGLLLTATTARTQAQQKAKVHRLAVVDPINPVGDISEATDLPYYRGFLQRLKQLGFAEGRNLEIKRYSAEGHSERFVDMISEVVNLKPDVIFAFGTRLVIILKGKTTMIPVVGLMSDPVRYGIVASMARPGGNITGVAHDPGVEFYGKRYKLLKEILPRASKLGMLIPPALVARIGGGAARLTEEAKRAGFELVLPSGDALYWREEDCRAAFTYFASNHVDVIVAFETNEDWAYRRLIIALAKEFRVPTIYPDRMFVELGGLMSYGPDWTDLGWDCARVTSEILDGANPANIPIPQPTKYELNLNLQTAKALGIDMPASVLVQAGKVIE
jgi:putative ABC transport system substrate-binding protein